MARAARAFSRYSSSSTTSRILRSSPRVQRGAGLLATGVFITVGLGTIYADSTTPDKGTDTPPTTMQTVGSLIRSYVVYTMCSVPVLVDYSPRLLAFLTGIPGIKQITEAVVRVTFFNQFVGGDTAHSTLPLLKQLRATNKGALFAYSVEVDEEEAAGSKKSKKDVELLQKRIVDEMIRCIDVAADFEDSVRAEGENLTKGRKTWVAVKMVFPSFLSQMACTALLPDAQSLINFSSYIIANRSAPPIPVAFPGYPEISDLDVLYKSTSNNAKVAATDSLPANSAAQTLTDEDIASLRDLHSNLIRICQRAQERGVRVIIDAEYSWYQPAIDALALSLTRQFNKLPDSKSGSSTSSVLPLVYGTYQAYLRRTPEHLKLSLLDSQKHNYSLGVKLVRGAYHPHELAAHQSRQKRPGDDGSVSKSGAHHDQSLSISPDPHPPVWETKADTDTCHNECAKALIQAIEEDLYSPSPSPSPAPSPAPLSSTSSSWLTPPSWITKLKGQRIPSAVVTSSVSPRLDIEPKIPAIGVLFGTHNWKSCDLILNELVRHGLASQELLLAGGKEPIIHLDEEVTERVTVGQLYGMSNALTDHLVGRTRSSSPLVIKYVPYGALSEVMPYLSRRAIENKSVLGDGGAADERRRAGSELWRRLFG
ncbi:FAD-linked oxidoreductase [Pleurotus eryngii]|uniref:Proline dehydrogenase n=1 Tax=Pleurotus eryngii TaxID=5323 RepID=A0A9P6D057_PLEER|nr:FAD-linked oxidoreductase [Pleurotus eryngii]